MGRFLAFAPLLGCVLLACPGSREGAAPRPSPVVESEIAPSVLADEREALMALGYLDASEETSDPARSGVVQLDEASVDDGVRLYCTRGEAMAQLIAVDGTPIRSWHGPGARGWAGCQLLPNGDLILIAWDLPPESEEGMRDEDRYLLRLAWDGTEVFRRDLPVHHDLFPLPDGGFLTLMLAYEKMPEIHPTQTVRDDLVTRLDGNGQVLETRSIAEVFRANPDALRLYVPKPVAGRDYIDLIHANTVERIDWPHLADRDPIYAPGNVIWTSRHQDLVAIVEWESNRLLWAWGQGEVTGPHDGRVLANGNVLVLDNGLPGRGSRVLEIDPLSRQVVWEYRGKNPGDFYTRERGGLQRLANGNTLITETTKARAIEVTRDGRIVWEFVNPHVDAQNKPFTFRRMRHYSRDQIEPLRRTEGAGD
jgi:hypothetical protein